MFLMLLALLTGCFDPAAGRDRDGDGFETWELGGPDCDDANPAINPSESELCGNNIDDDCDGFVDDAGVGGVTWYPDADRDGYGAEPAETGCVAPAASVSSVANGVDCDDSQANVFPGADEVWYDGIDQDCRGGDDYDADADGYVLSEDCDDTNEAVNPGSVEVCNNGLDDDCSGGAPECELTGEVAGISAGIPTRGDSMAAGDFDGDGAVDVAVWSEDEYVTEIWSSLPDVGPRRLLARITDTDCSWNKVWAGGDLTGDGVNNLLTSCGEEGLYVAMPSPLQGGARLLQRDDGLRLSDTAHPIVGDTRYSDDLPIVPVADVNGDGIDELMLQGAAGVAVALSPHAFEPSTAMDDWLPLAGPKWKVMPDRIWSEEPFLMLTETRAVFVAEVRWNLSEPSVVYGALPVLTLSEDESAQVEIWRYQDADSSSQLMGVGRLASSGQAVPVLTMVDPQTGTLVHEVSSLGPQDNGAEYRIRRGPLPCDLNRDGIADLVLLADRGTSLPVPPLDATYVEVYLGPHWASESTIAPDLWARAHPARDVRCTPDGLLYSGPAGPPLMLPAAGR